MGRIQLALVWVVGCLSCGGDPAGVGGSGGGGGGQQLPPVTWHQDVAPLLSEHCAGCHTQDALAERLPFMEYASTWAFAPLIAEAAVARTMPPFGAAETESCSPEHAWSHDSRLTDAQIQTLVDWDALGAPEGDAANPAELPQPGVVRLQEWDLEMGPPVPFPAIPGDYQICFPIPLELSETAWLEAVEVIPGDPRVVHHVQVRVDHEGSTLASANEDGWYTCTGALDGDEVGGYLPGSPPTEMPEDVGVPMEPGAVLAVQVHYFVPDDGVDYIDETKVRIRLADGEPTYVPRLMRMGNDSGPTASGGLQPGLGGETEFVIPAGASHHSELFRLDFAVPGRWAIFTVANHMHYVGIDARLWIERGDPAPGEAEEQCLLHTPRWDFDWQQTYNIDLSAEGVPVLVPGDTLWLECTFDNSPTNEAWMEQLDLLGMSIYDVPLGRGATSEMCAALIGAFDLDGGEP
jgi:hypothetical protein